MRAAAAKEAERIDDSAARDSGKVTTERCRKHPGARSATRSAFDVTSSPCGTVRLMWNRLGADVGGAEGDDFSAQMD